MPKLSVEEARSLFVVNRDWRVCWKRDGVPVRYSSLQWGGVGKVKYNGDWYNLGTIAWQVQVGEIPKRCSVRAIDGWLMGYHVGNLRLVGEQKITAEDYMRKNNIPPYFMFL